MPSRPLGAAHPVRAAWHWAGKGLGGLLNGVHALLTSNSNIYVVVGRKLAVNLLALYFLVLMTSVPVWPADTSLLTPGEQNAFAAMSGLSGARPGSVLHPFQVGLGPFLTAKIFVSMVSGTIGWNVFAFLPPPWRVTREQAATRSGQATVRFHVLPLAPWRGGAWTYSANT
jgi:hypothetical protein